METSADPTLHNLWPFEVLGVMVLASVTLGSLQLIRFFIIRSIRAEIH